MTRAPGRRPLSREEAYLLGLRLGGRRVVVVGGGAVAARRVPRLLAAGADVMLISPAVTPALEELAAQRRIDWRPREYQAGRLRERLAGGRVHGPAAGQRGGRGRGGAGPDLVRARR